MCYMNVFTYNSRNKLIYTNKIARYLAKGHCGGEECGKKKAY